MFSCGDQRPGERVSPVRTVENHRIPLITLVVQMLATLSGQALDVGSTTTAGHRHTNQRDAFTIALVLVAHYGASNRTPGNQSKPPDALNTIGAKPKTRQSPPCENRR